MHDLNTLLANHIPAWRLQAEQARRAIDGLTSRGPRRVAAKGHPSEAEILENARLDHEAELAPYQERLAIHQFALKAAESGLVPHYSARISAGHEWNAKHHELIQAAEAAGRALYPDKESLAPFGLGATHDR